jgi:hypothetical protein
MPFSLRWIMPVSNSMEDRPISDGRSSIPAMYRDYYYYPSGISLAATPALFTMPTSGTVNLIAGYSRKFRRVTWDIQLNVSNLFNHYDIVILPNATTGYTSTAGLNATFSNQPRAYTVTNTLKF